MPKAVWSPEFQRRSRCPSESELMNRLREEERRLFRGSWKIGREVPSQGTSSEGGRAKLRSEVHGKAARSRAALRGAPGAGVRVDAGRGSGCGRAREGLGGAARVRAARAGARGRP